MRENQHILPAVTHYWSAVEQAQQQTAAIDHLAITANSFKSAGQSVPPEAVARCHRAAGHMPIAAEPAPRNSDHWTSHYLQSTEQPSFRHANCTLTELASQTAATMDDSSHDENAAALFSAVTYILATQLAPIASQERSDLDAVHFADAVIRAGAYSCLDADIWKPIVSAALTIAADKLQEAIQDGQAHRQGDWSYDSIGRRFHATRPYARLTVAQRILQEAERMNCAGQESRDIINAAGQSDRWLIHSARACHYDTIPDQINYALATPAKFFPEQVNEIARLARAIIHAAEVTSIEPEWLIYSARYHASARFRDQHRLANQLDIYLRQYDDWYDSTMSFFANPDQGRVEALNAGHKKRMATFAHAIVCAASIAHVTLAKLRDAVIVAACGRMNRQCRQEFHMLQIHTDLKGENGLQALARIDIASKLVAIMPDSIIQPTVRQAVLRQDEEFRSHLSFLQE